MIKKIVKVIFLLVIVLLISILLINNNVKMKYKDKIINIEEVNKLENIDAIVVLGAKVNNESQVSLMLKDRLDKGIELFNTNISDVLLMSGDGRNKLNNETFAMVNYASNMGIDNKFIKEDKDGLSTSKSIYRLRDVYKYKKVIIVTQEYHLYRSLYIANEIGIDAYGISAQNKNYKGQLYRELREILARCKDYVLVFGK